MGLGVRCGASRSFRDAWRAGTVLLRRVAQWHPPGWHAIADSRTRIDPLRAQRASDRLGLGAVLALRSSRWRFGVEYVALALASLAVLVVATIVPRLAFSINMTRLFHISTLVLAPFCVTGGLLIAQSVVRLTTKSRETGRTALELRMVAAFFVTLFLFSSGFVYEVTHQGSMSFVLNSSVDAPIFNDREVAAGQWLNDTRGSVARGGLLIPIYADAHRRTLFDRFDLYHSATFFLQPRDTPPQLVHLPRHVQHRARPDREDRSDNAPGGNRN